MSDPATTFAAADAAFPAETNGVSLYTRAGLLKSRFTLPEQLQILGCTLEQLEAYIKLFVPRRTDFAITRAGSGNPRDWTGGRGTIGERQVIRHLLGSRLPNHNPVWIAPRAWDWTRFIAIDVDRRGDEHDFCRRCGKVEDALAALEIPPDARLIMPTPSGGRHYYCFTTAPTGTAEIAPVLASVGIVHRKGAFEVFPSTQRGLRLPYGHIPGQPHDPNAWIQFIKDYENGSFPRINWDRCKQQADRYATPLVCESALRVGQGFFDIPAPAPRAPKVEDQEPQAEHRTIEDVFGEFVSRMDFHPLDVFPVDTAGSPEDVSHQHFQAIVVPKQETHGGRFRWRSCQVVYGVFHRALATVDWIGECGGPAPRPTPNRLLYTCTNQLLDDNKPSIADRTAIPWGHIFVVPSPSIRTSQRAGWVVWAAFQCQGRPAGNRLAGE